MSCSYIYNGREYSEIGIIRKLANSGNLSFDRVAAITFYKEKLGMTENEVEIVFELIDNKSLGRFLEDGRVLLSSFATDSVVFHEGFHRVWRLYLNDSQRKIYIDDFMKRKDVKKIMDSYRGRYPKASNQELIEEYFADEFETYMLNGNTQTNSQIRTIFDKILTFIRKLLGLSTSEYKKLYKDIKNGKFAKGVKSGQPYKGSADKVILKDREGKDVEFTAQIKNDIVQSATRIVLSSIFAPGNNPEQSLIYDFIKDPSIMSSAKLYDLALKEVVNAIKDPAIKSAVTQDYINYKNTGNSYFNDQFRQYMATIGIETENMEIEVQNPEEDHEMSDVKQNEFTTTFEIDPKTNMSKAIKLLLASLYTDEINEIGLPKQVKWSSTFNTLLNELSDLPVEEIVNKLSLVDKPWVPTLLRFIGGKTPNIMNNKLMKLRNEFISTFNVPKTRFYVAQVESDNIYYFNANSNTEEAKVINQFANELNAKINEFKTYDQWFAALTELTKKKTAKLEDYLDLLGFNVNKALYNTKISEDKFFTDKIKDIAVEITKSKYTNTNLPNFAKIFKKEGFDIEGWVREIADKQTAFEEKTDLMVYLSGKKVFPIGLPTHITNTLTRLNYVADLVTSEMSLQERLDLVNKYSPDSLNVHTIRKDGTVRSAWLNNILYGKKVNLAIMSTVQDKKGNVSDIAKIDESDLYSMMLNSSIKSAKDVPGMQFAMKHADRSIFYAYEDMQFDYQNPSLNIKNADDVFNYMTAHLTELFIAEQEKVAAMSKSPLYAYQHYKGAKLFDESKMSKNAASSEVQTYLKGLVQSQFESYKKELENWKVTKVGISKELLKFYNNDLDLLIASSLANQMLSHIEEMRLLHGDFSFYKDADDFFKRTSTASSTGKGMNVDDFTNRRIEYLNSRDNFTIYNPKTGTTSNTITYNRPVNGRYVSVNAIEQKNYTSSLNDEKVISSITGTEISKLQAAFEWNGLRDFPNATEKQKKNIVKQSAMYADSYKTSNENDGQSWANIFFFREYMERLGYWNPKYERLFQVELKLLSAKTQEEIENITIEIDGVEVKAFEIGMDKYEQGHTLKSQHAGFSYLQSHYVDLVDAQKEFNSKVAPYTIGKTSLHILFPSVILGTNLQTMNSTLIETGTDIYHMDSAQKTGGANTKAIGGIVGDEELKTNGFTFYDKDGHFNDRPLREHYEKITLTNDFVNIKDQVKIGNKVKNKIKASTQSMKILMSNLLNNGVPRFEGADQILNEYTSTMVKIIDNNIDSLLKQLDHNGIEYQTLNKLAAKIKKAAIEKDSPINIIEAIETFVDNPYLETVPNRNKLENIMYAIVNNGAIDFQRPGNAYVQVASTGYEPIGSRKGLTSNFLKFYEPVFDNEGNITEVKPAEIIIALPKQWIPNVLQRYKKELQAEGKVNNIAAAIRLLNRDIEAGLLDDEVTFKGLRIPNQQLSSNDIFKVKRFNIPTMESYVIVPTELVVKTGGDFDVDKLNIFWKKPLFSDLKQEDDYQKEYAEYNKLVSEFNLEALSYKDWYSVQYGDSNLVNRLLELEKTILLHPRNYHLLMMPIVDDLLKKDAYKYIVEQLEGKSKDNTKFIDTLFPVKNHEKSINFVKGKFGVGIGALDITGQSTHTASNIRLNKFFNQGETVINNVLPFETSEDTYSLGGIHDSSGRIIIEVLSQLLTSQVDVGKDDYPVKLGINNQTLPVLTFLIRRRIPVMESLMLFKQPIIQEYLTAHRINKSLINKRVKHAEVNKKHLINNVFAKMGIPVQTKANLNFIATVDKLEKGIKGDKTNQAQFLLHFLNIQDQTNAFGNWKNMQSVDTKNVKNKAALDNWKDLKQKVLQEDFVENPEDFIKNGPLQAFFRAYDLNTTLFNQFYAYERDGIKDKLNEIRSVYSSRIKTPHKREKLQTTLENDFVLYALMKYHPDFKNYKELMTGDKSVAKRLSELGKSNIAVAQLVSTFDKSFANVVTDPNQISSATLNKGVDTIRIYDRAPTTIDLNDYINALHDLKDEDPELYKDLIKVSFVQAGLNNSNLNMMKIFPTLSEVVRTSNGDLVSYKIDYTAKLLKEAINIINYDITDNDFTQYQYEFERNNPTFLQYKYYDWGKNSIHIYKYDDTDKKMVLIERGKEVPLLGDSNIKQYGVFNDMSKPPAEFNKKSKLPKVNSIEAAYDSFTSVGEELGINDLGSIIPKEEYYQQLYQELINLNKDVIFEVYPTNEDMRLDAYRELASAGFTDTAAGVYNEENADALVIHGLEKILVSKQSSKYSPIHELVHLTLQKEYEKKGEFAARINELYSIADEKYMERHPTKTDERGYKNIDLSDVPHGFSSPTEFLAEALSNPDFMTLLNEMEYESTNVFTRFMKLVSEVLNNIFGTTLNENSVLAQVFRETDKYLNDTVSDTLVEFDNLAYLSEEQRSIAAEIINNGEIKYQC